MGILYVNWNRMDQAACGAKQVSRRLQEISEEILFVKNSLKFSGAYSDTLDSRLKQLLIWGNIFGTAHPRSGMNFPIMSLMPGTASLMRPLMRLIMLLILRMM